MELVGTAEGTLLLKIAIRYGAEPFTPADEDAIVLSNLAEKGFVIEVDVDTYRMTFAGAQAVFEGKTVMIINLTAPEVHPPQQIILRTDSNGVQRASLWGVSIDGEPLAYLGGWDDKRGVTVMYDDVYLSVDYAWYLSWAFRDIAEEAARIEASLAADCYDPRDAVEPRSVLDHDDYAEFDCIE